MAHVTEQFKKDHPIKPKTEFDAKINELNRLVREMQRDLNTLKDQRRQDLLTEAAERKREHRRLKDDVEALKNAVNSLIRK